jgi:hypothetical protein
VATASPETPSQQPTSIEHYEHDATCGKFNIQNRPLVLSDFDELDYSPEKIDGGKPASASVASLKSLSWLLR